MKYIPYLDSSLEEYYKAILPFMSRERAQIVYTDIERYKHMYKTLLPRLVQDYLKEETQHYNTRRMLEEYCSLREPLPLASNFGIHTHTFDKDNLHTPLEYTAHVIHAISKLYHTISINNPSHPIGNCFGVCKIPALEIDTLQYTSSPIHYLIYYKGNCYDIRQF